MQAKEFALYKGEELIAMGTKKEIAEQLGVSASTIGYYGTPVYARRVSESWVFNCEGIEIEEVG